jgi:hypothetical protein
MRNVPLCQLYVVIRERTFRLSEAPVLFASTIFVACPKIVRILMNNLYPSSRDLRVYHRNLRVTGQESLRYKRS